MANREPVKAFRERRLAEAQKLKELALNDSISSQPTQE
jgi:hypothetical protein